MEGLVWEKVTQIKSLPCSLIFRLLQTYRVPPHGAPQITKDFALNMILLKGTSDASKATVVNGVAGCTEVRKYLFLKSRKVTTC